MNRKPTALENTNILDLDVKIDWNNDAIVISEHKKKFLFDYVADGLKGTSIPRMVCVNIRSLSFLRFQFSSLTTLSLS